MMVLVAVVDKMWTVAETVVGATTGVVMPPKGYIKAVKSVCDKYGALLILDEVMSGMGRLGTTHAWQTFDGVAPDLQTIAKGLGGGYACIGAVLLSKRVASGIRDSSGFMKHGHTYQSHPISTAAALAVQKVIASENLLENVRIQAAYISTLLHERFLGPNSILAPWVFDIRGAGAWWAVEFDFDSEADPSKPKPLVDFKGSRYSMLVQQRCMEKGLIVMGFHGGANIEGTKGDHVMLSPAYNVTRDEVTKIVNILVEAAEEVLKESLV